MARLIDAKKATDTWLGWFLVGPPTSYGSLSDPDIQGFDSELQMTLLRVYTVKQVEFVTIYRRFQGKMIN